MARTELLGYVRDDSLGELVVETILPEPTQMSFITYRAFVKTMMQLSRGSWPQPVRVVFM